MQEAGLGTALNQQQRFGGLGGQPAPFHQPIMSDSIAKMAAALSLAQSAMEGAKKDSKNPFFKSSYADLASVWDAIRGPLAKNNLSVVQLTGGDSVGVKITTILMHSSGEWIRSDLTMKPSKPDPQGVGSCITYARRYALSAMVGVAPEDDDGQAATYGAPKSQYHPKGMPKAKEPVEDELESGYQRNVGSDDLVSRRSELFRKLIGKDAKFGNKILDAKKWVAKVTHGADINDLNSAQCTQVELELEK